jgi:hypothetical protein
MVKHYIFALVGLCLVAYISSNVATTAKHTDSTFQKVESIVKLTKQK